MHRNTPNAIEAEPYTIAYEIVLFLSNKKAVRMAKPPKRNKITAAMTFKASLSTFSLSLKAKTMISVPPNNNRIDRINCNQAYLLNNFFI